MSEIIGYRIQQITDNGHAVQMSLIEDVQTEPLSQKTTNHGKCGKEIR